MLPIRTAAKRGAIRVLCAALATCLVLGARAAHAQPGEYKVVVNADNPMTSVSRDVVAAMFLKRQTRWPGGAEVTPVDLGSASPVRAAFSRTVLGKQMAQVSAYWQQQIFSGRGTPPPEKAGDAAVLSYVAASPGAIGYVSAGASAPGTKVVAIRP
ncbi:MAG TPA: hypothetical protein VGD56_07665 [Gemmatirosa sp.]